MKPLVSILLPCYSSYELFNKVFPMSLSEIIINCDFELIMYNNGGGFEKILEHEEFKRFKNNPRLTNPRLSNVEFIGDGKNIGLNPALNVCARIAKGTYYFLPHVDMFMLPNCLQSLINVAKNQPPASFLLCSRSIEPTKGHTNHHIIEDYGKEPFEFNNDINGVKNSNANKVLEKYGASYKNHTIEVGARMPFFMHRKLWEKMQGVDPNYFSYCTDDDLIQAAWHCRSKKILDDIW